jgi:hypothetical protein
MSVATVIEKARSYGWCDVLVVDDHSSDRTGKIAIEAGAHVVRHPITLGAWGAIQTGLIWGLKSPYDYFVTVDADDQHEPKFISTLLESSVFLGSDIAIGSCTNRGTIGKKLVWWLLRRVSGLEIGDITSGFRAYSRRAAHLLTSSSAALFEFQDVGVLMLAKNHQLKTIEIMVEMNNRRYGNSRVYTNYFVIARYIAATLLLAHARR